MPNNQPTGDLREMLYSVSQVAAALDLSEQRVRALAKSRHLGRRIGERVLVFTSADIAAMQERKPGRPRKDG